MRLPFGGSRSERLHEPEELISAELFSIERLEQHGESLAAAQRVSATPRARGRPLAVRLRENAAVLLDAYRSIAASSGDDRAISPAAEWLVDNIHVVEEQIREIRDDLPREFYRELPKLADGPLAGLPRVYGVAWAFVAHTDSRFDPELLRAFLRAYQRVQPLTIGELWAVAITLRIVLVENLRRAADRMLIGRRARDAADAIADRLLADGGGEPVRAEDVLRELERRPMPRAFGVQLIQRLRGQDPQVVLPALRWLDERLAADNTSADERVREEHQRQAALNVTVRNIVTSMRHLSTVDWSEFFESVSLVDARLREGSSFAEVDFATRDRYRHAIEALARGSRFTELEVAERAVSEAHAPDSPSRDPGQVLIGSGLRAFEAELGYRPPFWQWLDRLSASTGMPGYLTLLGVLSVALLALPLVVLAQNGAPPLALALLALLGAIPASDVAVTLLNRGITTQFGPRPLPALALREGVPASLRTLLVVPTLFASREDVEQQIERLEVHSLASGGGELYFALLSDWLDADTEQRAGDDELLAVAAQGIARLNRTHGPAPAGDRFFLLHRRRVWSETERKWIGWERKRGKLHELNRLLRGARDTSFLALSGDAPRVPADVRYVITLDSDTRLARGAAVKLIGKMAHPLNRPRVDRALQRVVDGYAVLQPRVTPALPWGAEGTWFQRIFAGPCGIDPYAFAASDVYQDLIGEGSYTGKGIYDVDAFEAALSGRIPEGTVLSHDLLEGIFAGAGLASDIEVVEDFPAHYEVAASRQHRWARGDWQLLPWIASRGIPLAGRWKMLDNLRRSLSPACAFLALLAGWTLPPYPAAVWSGFVVATIALPIWLPLLDGAIPSRAGVSKRTFLSAFARDLALAVAQTLFRVTLLADQAWRMSDAIARTLYRVGVSRRRLLEWVTAAQAQAQSLQSRDWLGCHRRMAGGLLLSALVAAGIGLGAFEASALAAAGVFVWLLAPSAVHLSGLPVVAAEPSLLGSETRRSLQSTARRTWRYFERFVGAEDSMLPPDNFQETPVGVVAHRTSPTNLGLHLLASAVARDFGWLGALDTVARLEESLGAMERLERFRGHFYNWYDTRDGRPLDPKYVSTVDSGNLAGHLIALRGALQEMRKAPLVHPRWRSGVGDALAIARESAQDLPDDRRTHTVTLRQVLAALDALAPLVDTPAEVPAEFAARCAALAVAAETLVDVARTFVAERGDDPGTELEFWPNAVRASVRSHARDLVDLLPWARLAWKESPALQELASSPPTLGELPGWCALALAQLELCGPSDEATALAAALQRSADAARSLLSRIESLEALCTRRIDEMEFGYLLDSGRQLLSIGYRVVEGALDPNCYDLLASEARLASLVAIAKGEIPVQHWFRLGRPLTPLGFSAALISWSGSMFEYLMPSLVVRAPPGSLLAQTSRLVVRRQVQYGARRGIPWGVSESAFSARDLEFTYQYSNFGVPGLGLKRGLGDDAVVAPYATALAAMVDPSAAVANFERMRGIGALGRYGWYEALDYTPQRLPEGESVVLVRAYMAHHQGMTIVAIANTLHDAAMRARFHSDPMIRASDLLLQERTPRSVAVARPRAEEVQATTRLRALAPAAVRRFESAQHGVPRAHLLANGRYAVMLTAAGGGYSRWRDLAVTRWREDRTRDALGSFTYLRDVHDGTVWSAGLQPTGIEPDRCEITFAEDQATILRRDGTLATTLELVVSPEVDAEVRRISISNLGPRTRELEVTSYAELVLAHPAADAAHRAFSNLFVRTEYVAELGALLATRRPRAAEDRPVWAGHFAFVEGATVGEPQFETDRTRFLGRGRDARSAVAISDGRPLSNTVGAVLDPIFSLRRRVRVPAGGTVRLNFWTLVASTRDELLAAIDQQRDATAFERASTLAWTRAQVDLHHLGIEPDEARLFQQLANHLVFWDGGLRASTSAQRRSEGGPSDLWALGISGDLPIVLVQIDASEDLYVARQLVRAHEYWRSKNLAVDLVFLNERPGSYLQELQESLLAIVRTGESRRRSAPEFPLGSVLVLRTDQVQPRARDVLQVAARVWLVTGRGSLAEQLERLGDAGLAPALPPPVEAPKRESSGPVRAPEPELAFWNGVGGFSEDGSEYVTVLDDGATTPAPWINVIANPGFGCHVSAEGGGYTWSQNSRENQLTPWSNDAVRDPAGDAFYVRDDESGVLFGPTLQPIRDARGRYVARHGQGYSVFERVTRGIALRLTVCVAIDDSVKIARLLLENRSARARRLSVTAYAHWQLGPPGGGEAAHVVTECDPELQAMFARNAWRGEFRERIAFADLAGRQTSWTADRTEFIGRNGSIEQPFALTRDAPLSRRTGAGLDPCAALQTELELRPGARTEVVLLLGDAASRDEARGLIQKYRGADLDAVLEAVRGRWDGVLGSVRVRTPDASLDLLMNRWLLYQTLACRIWARSGFYQAGGAFGFRDQLQDGAALAIARPDLTRAHLLRAAGRQFEAGDVQHWWLPSSGRGVRSRNSDDVLWLVWATADYVRVSGDRAVLDEPVPFLDGELLRDDQTESFFEPGVAATGATLYEHCARALERAFSLGPHGLPRIGSGDWNDGMNRVGVGGSGESVWLAWFLLRAVDDLAPFADERGDKARAGEWRVAAAKLREAVERHAWDGAWYRRGFFDDGTPLGSVLATECRIDSIAQSWAVLSRAGDPARARRAMAAVEEYLLRRDDELLLLFTPPFDRSAQDPGYIKSYPPGIRENGGQYSHAAVWAAIAFAELGEGDKAMELLTLLNPIQRASTRAGLHRYRVEPYVVSADVYAETQHVGRGGWTWYTGSAAWLYRAVLESILGVRVRGDRLYVDPCIPRGWRGFEVVLQRGAARYEISVQNPSGVSRGVTRIALDGVAQPLDRAISVVEQAGTHRVAVTLG